MRQAPAASRNGQREGSRMRSTARAHRECAGSRACNRARIEARRGVVRQPARAETNRPAEAAQRPNRYGVAGARPTSHRLGTRRRRDTEISCRRRVHYQRDCR